LKSVNVLNESGDVCKRFTVRDNIYIEIEYEIYEVLKSLDAAFHLVNQRNERVFYTFDDIEKRSWNERKKFPGKYVSRCKIPGDFLNDGTYSITVALSDNKVYSQKDDAVSFQVDDVMDPNGSRGLYSYEWVNSTVRPKLEWDVVYVE
jgi:lipopolysaccharide transport system ATP-binding protein